MRPRARFSGPSFVLGLLLLAPACGDDAGFSSIADGGSHSDGAAGSDVPPATAPCASLTTTTEIKGYFDTDQTWRGIIAVTGEVYLADATVTIEPGTTFVMGPDSSIEFGAFFHATTVFARGTEAAPIRFCGKAPLPGYFDRVIVGPYITSDSVFENVSISDGGQRHYRPAEGWEWSPALDLRGPILLKNVQVTGSGGDGVHASDFKAGSEKLTVTGAANIGLLLHNSRAVNHLPLGGAYKPNGIEVVALRGGISGQDFVTTFRDPGVPYLIGGDGTPDRAKITLDAGVEFRLAAGAELRFGYNGVRPSSDVTVTINGTADKPVVFAGTGDGPWKSIVVGPGVTSDSAFRHVKVRGGGSGGPALHIQAPLTIDHLTLENNLTGLQVEGAGFAASSTTLTITGTAAAPATVTPDAAITLPKGGAFIGNSGNDWIVIKGGEYAATGTLPNLGVPYRIDEDIITVGQSSLTIEAGTTFLMGAHTSIHFGWNSTVATVIAAGTSEKPIVFRAAGDDVAGYWSGLIVGSMVTGPSKMEWVQLRNGGQASGSALRVHKAFTVTNSNFGWSAGVGIMKEAGDGTDYTAGNTFEMCAMGNVAP